jgi:hypothetical protein
MAQETEIREGVRDMLSPSGANDRLEEAVAERPLAKYLLDLKILARAVAIAAVLTIIFAILFSPILGAVVLILSFFASWILLAVRGYEQRRPTVRRGEHHEVGDSEDDRED